MTYPIIFVSLGPGDPELITLKGLKALQQADYVYCPSTQTPGVKPASRSLSILNALEISPEKIRLFNLPMNKNRSSAWETYNRIAKEASVFYREGKKVTIVAEGDAGFYSSIHYIYDKFRENDIPVERIAGIPAFIAAGAVAGLHIVKQEEPLLVLPGIVTTEELEKALREEKTIVIMKLSQCETTVKNCMDKCPGYGWHYFENIGLEQAYYSCNVEEIKKKKFPYFSLIIIKSTENDRTPID